MGDRDDECLFADQCYSNICTNSKCICGKSAPISHDKDCLTGNSSLMRKTFQNFSKLLKLLKLSKFSKVSKLSKLSKLINNFLQRESFSNRVM